MRHYSKACPARKLTSKYAALFERLPSTEINKRICGTIRCQGSDWSRKCVLTRDSVSPQKRRLKRSPCDVISESHNTRWQTALHQHSTASYPHKTQAHLAHFVDIRSAVLARQEPYSPDKCLALTDSITSTLHNATTQLDTGTQLGTATQPDTAR
jgi:hypothetical protein